jgi:hypothetical protein
MKLHPVVTQQGGIVSVQLQAKFAGDSLDQSDQAKIQALGDPKVNIAGTFTDPNDTSPTPFTFQFPTSEKLVGVTTEMLNFSIRFMAVLPQSSMPNQPVPVQGPLDCLTPDPGRAAQIWVTVMAGAGVGRVAQVMTALRANVLLPVFNDFTV